MDRKSISTILAIWMALGLSACGGKHVIVTQATPTPAWVDRMPKRQGNLCAVGYSGPTFYQQDCLGNAAQNARGHLADTISATIRTVTIDISDGTRGSFSRDVFVVGSETASEAVLQGSEVEAQWYDLVGQRGAPKGCFAMVCIDPSKPLDQMIEQLEKKLPPKAVEQVRANAEAAFEDLEREEAKREPKAAPPPKPEPEATPEADAPPPPPPPPPPPAPTPGKIEPQPVPPTDPVPPAEPGQDEDEGEQDPNE